MINTYIFFFSIFIFEAIIFLQYCSSIFTGKRLITTKENKTLHGHGLKIIERVVNRYRGNMDYYYSEECHEFHMIIAMKDPRM